MKNVILFISLTAALIFAGCPSPGGSGGADSGMGTFTVTIGNGSKSALDWDSSVDSEKLEHTITLSGGPGSAPDPVTIPPGGGTASFTVAEGWWNVRVEGKLLDGTVKSVGTERVNVKAGQKNTVSVTMSEPAAAPGGPNGPTKPPTDLPGEPTYPPPDVSGATGTYYAATRGEWDTAVSAIRNNSGVYVIYLTGSFSVPGVTTATFGTTPTGFTLKVYIIGNHEISLSAPGYLLYIGTRQAVVVHDAKLKGHSANTMSLVSLGSSSTFTMQGNASVSGNTSSDNYSTGGVDVIGTFNMKDSASVTGNTTNGRGGGVYVSGTFNMQGSASVSGNTSGLTGGGVIVNSFGTFQIESGTVYGNTATTNGGAALYVTDGTASASHGTFADPGDTTSTWTSVGTLSTTDSTIKVENGVLLP
jgi:hypothetical protein